MSGVSPLHSHSTVTLNHENGTPTGFQVGWFAPTTHNTIQEAWEDSTAIILFVKVEPTDQATFIKSLKSFLLDPLRKSIRILWIENPDGHLSTWRTYSLSVVQKPGNILSTPHFNTFFKNRDALLADSIWQDLQFKSVANTDDPLNAWLSVMSFGVEQRIDALSYIDFKNYSLAISSSSGIRLKMDKFEITRHKNNPQGFEWSTSYGRHRIFSLEPDIKIPISGKMTGCLLFDINLLRKDIGDHAFHYPDLVEMDIGMRVFFRDPDFPNDPDTFYISSNKYALFQERSSNLLAKSEYPTNISLRATLDPFYPLVEERSFFTFKPLGANGIPSAYYTNYGFDVHMLPIHSESQLVFAQKPDLLDPEAIAEAPYYLVPKGRFKLKVPRYSGGDIDPASMDCGISGLEYINISAGSEINFVTGRAAFSGAFLSIRSLLRDFNTIQKQFQRSAWINPKTKELLVGTPIDLPESTDLDMEVEATDGLNISDAGRDAMLDFVIGNYFPDSFSISENQRKAHLEIKIAEDWIQSYRDMMKEATISIGRAGSLLSDEIKTSWVYIRSNPNATYFAQPDNAVLHLAEGSSNDFLDYMEVPTLGLPLTAKAPLKLAELTGSSELAFPMMPYGNVDPHAITDIRQMEMLVLNPVRRKTLQFIGEADIDTSGLNPKSFSTPLPAGSTTNRLGTTPQGLISKFSSTWEDILELRLAKDTKNKEIGFADILHGSPMKGALQANQLFLVISDPSAVMDYFSNAKLDAVRNDPNRNTQLDNDLDILDWIFELGPGFWDLQGTIMVFKYTNTSLYEMAAQPENWFMADTFNRNPKGTSEKLQELLAEAIEFGKSSDPKEKRKYESLSTAATQPNWTGILMLNVHVPLRGLPDSLKALAGGMNPDLFYANFVGVEVTQVKTSGTGPSTSLDPQQSSLFALIDYKNPATPRAEASGFNFHVPFLSIVFKNSHIVHFAAEVLLIMEKLFDERAKLLNSNKNIITLKGVAEEHNGRVTYAFGFSGANRFKLSGKVFEEVEIIKAQFSTDPLGPKPRPNTLSITGRFSLWGRIRFAYLREFDILSFGRIPANNPDNLLTPAATQPPPDYLSVSNMEVKMTFDLKQDTNEVLNRQFHFNPNKLAFDLVKSGWRNQSLYEQFPLTFRGFKHVKSAPGAAVKTGYMPVSVPIKRANLGENYYAMKFDLKLGSLGALSGSKPLGAEILVAWNPNKEGLFVGLKLAGSSSDKKEITIQGLLKLSFGSIRFVVFDKENIPTSETEDQRVKREKKERQVGYLLNLKNIKLTFFLLTFPPIGQTEMTLFGDPRDGIERVDRLVGWYAAYVKK